MSPQWPDPEELLRQFAPIESQWTALQAAIEAQRLQMGEVLRQITDRSVLDGSELARAFLLHLPEDWTQLIAVAARTIEQTIDDLKANSYNLGANGWTITDDMDLGVCRRLLNKPQELVERFYRRKYTGAAIAQLAQGLSTNPRTEPMSPLVEQIHSALRRRHYQVALPAAVVLLEAILARHLGIRDQRIIDPVRRHSQSLREIEYLMWFSVEGFVAEFYARKPFDGPRPSLINRHWVIHGRDDPALWTKLDVLKVLNAISTIAVVL